jgi:hypothetical protein
MFWKSVSPCHDMLNDVKPIASLEIGDSSVPQGLFVSLRDQRFLHRQSTASALALQCFPQLRDEIKSNGQNVQQACKGLCNTASFSKQHIACPSILHRSDGAN